MAQEFELSRLRDPNKVLFDRFNEAPLAVAIQKGGSLTDISRNIIWEEFEIPIPLKPRTERIPLEISSTDRYGDVGIYYGKNKALGSLVADGTVDIGIVGTDRILEEELIQNPDILVTKVYPNYQWDIVLASPPERGFSGLTDIGTVATQYPKITETSFARAGNTNVRIIETAGGTETYARNRRGRTRYDAIVDLSDTGTSLRAHGLEQIGEPLCSVSPTLIFNARSVKEKPEIAQIVR